MLELHHGAPMGFHLKPLIALHEKGVAFESRPYDPATFAQYAAPWAAETEVRYNLEVEGPVLVADGQAMTDALFINIYIDDSRPGPALAPSDADGHWNLLMWGRHVGEVLAPSVHSLGCAASPTKADAAAIAALPTPEKQDGWRKAVGGETAEVLADSRRKAGLSVAKIEAALAKADWLGGGAYGLTDIEVFGHAVALPDLVPDLANATDSPRLMDWLARVAARPAVQAALATPSPAPRAWIPGPEHSRWG